jgi:hypothetical protein
MNKGNGNTGSVLPVLPTVAAFHGSSLSPIKTSLMPGFHTINNIPYRSQRQLTPAKNIRRRHSSEIVDPTETDTINTSPRNLSINFSLAIALIYLELFLHLHSAFRKDSRWESEMASESLYRLIYEKQLATADSSIQVQSSLMILTIDPRLRNTRYYLFTSSGAASFHARIFPGFSYGIHHLPYLNLLVTIRIYLVIQ